jgi:hypothetical protein
MMMTITIIKNKRSSECFPISSWLSKNRGCPEPVRDSLQKCLLKKVPAFVEYKGKLQRWKDVKAEDGHNGYLMYITRNAVINALPAIKTKGRYANDARGLSRKKRLTNNAEYVSVGVRAT